MGYTTFSDKPKSLPGHCLVFPDAKPPKKNRSSSSSCRKSLNSANSRSCNFFWDRGTLKWCASSGFRHQHHQLDQQTSPSSGKKTPHKIAVIEPNHLVLTKLQWSKCTGVMHRLKCHRHRMVSYMVSPVVKLFDQ